MADENPNNEEPKETPRDLNKKREERKKRREDRARKRQDGQAEDNTGGQGGQSGGNTGGQGGQTGGNTGGQGGQTGGNIGGQGGQTGGNTGGQGGQSGGNTGGQGGQSGGNTGGQGGQAGGNTGGQTGAPAKVRPVMSGISSAYGVGEFDAPKTEVATKEKNKPKNEKPKRDKTQVKTSNEKNIMEFFWKEFIIKFYEWSLSKAVDETLNFVEWLAFYEKSEKTPKPPKEILNKEPYKIGKQLYEDRTKDEISNADFLTKAHNEIVENIDREKAGVRPEWKIWGSEPAFYKPLKLIEAKAESDPNSPQAKKWDKFKESPKILDTLLTEHKLLCQYAIMSSTLNEVISPDSEKIPRSLTVNITKIDKVLKDKKKGATEIKAETLKCVNDMIKDINVKEEGYKPLLDNLAELVNTASGPDTDRKVVKKSLEDTLVKVRKESVQISKDPKLVKARMDQNSKTYYDEINNNLDKIRETYSGNPDKVLEVSQEYMMNISEAIKDAKSKINAVEGSTFTKLKKRSANNEYKNIEKAITGFKIGKNSIGNVADPKDKSPQPLKGKKTQMFRVYQDYVVRNL